MAAAISPWSSQNPSLPSNPRCASNLVAVEAPDSDDPTADSLLPRAFPAPAVSKTLAHVAAACGPSTRPPRQLLSRRAARGGHERRAEGPVTGQEPRWRGGKVANAATSSEGVTAVNSPVGRSSQPLSIGPDPSSSSQRRDRRADPSEREVEQQR
ncbi:MAG: hypothetical protein WAL22_08735 [Solirubrobacteraceae bacterium]